MLNVEEHDEVFSLSNKIQKHDDRASKWSFINDVPDFDTAKYVMTSFRDALKVKKGTSLN